MTREEAEQILIYWDDSVWQRDHHITCGMLSEAINLAVETLNPWHKVSEELPKETCEVLICWDTYGHYRKWTQIVMFYRDANNPEKGWFEDEDEGRPEPDYWMPIPELPKEE